MVPAEQLLRRFIDFIIEPAIALIFTAGFFLFVWGLVQFLWTLEEGSHEEGKRHMVWGIVGMFVMVSVWGIIMILNATFDLGLGADGSYNPDVGAIEGLPGDFFGGGEQ